MTWVTSSTSMPRAATSVATSTSTLPERNARSACSRAPWPRSPCTAADGEAALGEVVGHLCRGALGAAEDHGQAAALGLQDARQHLDLVHRVRAEDVLLDCLDGLRRRRRGRPRGCASAGACSGGPARRSAPGMVAENSMVWRPAGISAHDPLDVGQEAQVEHLVGLVEHEGAHVAEVEVALLGQVDQPARGADDDVDAGAQRLDLRLVGAAAVDGEHADRRGRGGHLEVAGDLDAQLAGGDDDERLRLAGVTAPAVASSGSSSGPTTRWSSGMPKPRVLPVPVLAWPMMSCPCRATGRVSSWMANGWVMPTASSASTVAGRTPSSANDWVFRTGPFCEGVPCRCRAAGDRVIGVRPAVRGRTPSWTAGRSGNGRIGRSRSFRRATGHP